MSHPLDTRILQRVRRVQWITVTWMSAEALISLWAAWRAKSPALLAFGGDSAIELASAILVLRSFRAKPVADQSERRAARLEGALLLALAGLVTIESCLALAGYTEPRPSTAGILVLIAASAFMPFLASEKRTLAQQIGSAALKADAVESALCGYFSLIALLGLLTNAVWHIRWADPAVALVIVPMIVREGWEVLNDKACG